MPAVFDAQKSLGGGMNSLMETYRIPEDAYVSAKNMEFRDGARSRRGSTRLAADAGGLGFTLPEEVETSFMYRDPYTGQTTLLVIQGSTVYFFDTLTWQRSYLTLPGTMPNAPSYHIVQAYNNAYFFFGDGNDVWKWDGDRRAAITVATDIPGGDYAFYGYNRLWVVTNGDTLNISDQLSENFDLVNNSFQVDFGDGSKIVALRSFLEGYILVFKEEGIAVISGTNQFTDANDLALQWIDTEHGCSAADSIRVIGKDVVYLSNGDVRTIQQTELSKAQSTDVTLSRDIPGMIKRINWQAAGGSQGIVFDNYYLLAVPFDEAQHPNTILAYDLLTQKWVSYWQYTDSNSSENDGLWRHVSLVIDRSGPNDELISVNRDGGVAKLLEGEYQDFLCNRLTGLQSIDNEQIQMFFTEFGAEFNLLQDETGSVDIVFSMPSAGVVDFGLFAIDYINGSAQQISVYLYITYDDSTKKITTRFVAYTEVGGARSFQETAVFDVGRYYVSGEDIFRLSLVQDGITGNGRVFLGDIVADSRVNVVTGAGADTDWLGNMGAPGSSGSVYIYTAGSGSAARLALYSVSVYGPNRQLDYRFKIPLDEGTGSTVNGYDIPNTVVITGTKDAGQTWRRSGFAPSEIVSELVTRGFSFQSEHDMKKLVRGDITYLHRQATVTALLRTNIPFEQFTLFSGKTFSLVEYDIHGVDDWVTSNVNDDFDDPYRQDYAPVNVASTGIILASPGLTIDKEAEHTVPFAPIAMAPWFQFVISTTQGYVNYKSIAMEGRVSRPFADSRSKGNV